MHHQSEQSHQKLCELDITHLMVTLARLSLRESFWAVLPDGVKSNPKHPEIFGEICFSEGIYPALQPHLSPTQFSHMAPQRISSRN